MEVSLTWTHFVICNFSLRNFKLNRTESKRTSLENSGGSFEEPPSCFPSCSPSQHLGRQLAPPPLLAAITLIITPVNPVRCPPPG